MLVAMTVFSAPRIRPYQHRFRIISFSAIAVLLAIFLFSIYEPESVGRSTNVALAYFTGAIMLGVTGYGLALAPKQSLFEKTQGVEWELTDDRLIERAKDGRNSTITLSEIKRLGEVGGFLVVSGGEPRSTIMIPHFVEGFEEIREQLAARSPVKPRRGKLKLAVVLPIVLGPAALVGLLFSHVFPLVLLSSALLALIQIWTLTSARKLSRKKVMPKMIIVAWIVTSLILAWLMFDRIKAAIPPHA